MSRAARFPSPSASTTMDGPRITSPPTNTLPSTRPCSSAVITPPSLRYSGSHASCWTWPIAIMIVSQATSRSVPGTSRGTTAPLSSLASAASHSTAPVTWSSADSTRTSAVFGANATPSSRACSRSSGTMSSSVSDSSETIVAWPPPSLIADLAASEAVLPPPITSTWLPTVTGRPRPASRRNSSAPTTPRDPMPSTGSLRPTSWPRARNAAG